MSINGLSISKHSGALISSKLIAEKIGQIFLIRSLTFSGFFSVIHKGTRSTPPSYLNKQDFPSITGNPSNAPMSPNPNTAVPLVMIADKFLLHVMSHAFRIKFI